MQLFVHQLSKRVKYGALIWEKKFIYVYTHLFGNVLPHSQPSKNNLWHAIENSLLLRGYWTNSDGVFAEMQIISYNFIILKHIQINSQFREILMLKVRLSFWDNKWWPFIRILGSRLSMNRPFIINIGLGWFRCAVGLWMKIILTVQSAQIFIRMFFIKCLISWWNVGYWQSITTQTLHKTL